jgi:hypothetical protein
MRHALPAPAALLGPAGLIPFAGLAIAALAGWPPAAPALLAYGATILAFLGAVHWGLALASEEARADWARLGLGVVPALIAWVALLLPPAAGLWLLAIGIAGTALVEHLGARAGLVPPGYMRLRWQLSAGATACLALGSAGL